MNEPLVVPAKKASDIVESLTESVIKLNISAEQLQAHNKRQREFVKRQNTFKVEELRRRWQAPQRHVVESPDFSGEWGAKFTVLQQMFIANTGLTLALVGERGNGKTQLAVELMRWFTSLLKPALFTTAIGFFIAVKTSYRKDSEQTEKAIMEEFGKPQLLVIDEIGKRSDSDWENNMLFELLNRRYNDLKDTILIANKSKAEFQDYIGPSLASRMNETGGIVECNWPSFRI